jgi:quinol monooxygenase YgiN
MPLEHNSRTLQIRIRSYKIADTLRARCEIFELNEDPQKPSRFLVYERWCSLAGIEAHLRKKHAAELRTLFHRLIVDGPEFQIPLPAE